MSATDQNDARASFSNYGRNCADIAAPGAQMYSTQASVAGLGLYGGGWGGTSLAAPLVSGAAALMRSLYPALTPSHILTALQISVDPITGLNPKGQRGTLGSGRLNMRRALEAAGDIAASLPVQTTQPPEQTTPQASASSLSVGKFAEPFAVGSGAGDTGRVETSAGKISSGGSWQPYGATFMGGVHVAIGQVDNDAGFEIITAPGAGGGPHVKVFDEHGVLESEFFAYEKDFRGGVSVTAADVDGDGIDEILTAPGSGRDPVVRFHKPSGALINEIPLREFSGTSTLFLASGDMDGDGADDVIVTDDQGDARVYVYRLYGTQQTSFLSAPQHVTGAVHADVWVGVDGKRYVVVRNESATDTLVRFFTYIGAFVSQFDPSGNPGDNGDIAVWQAKDGSDPVIVTSEWTGTAPELFGYDRTGNLSSSQLFLEQSYKKPVSLSR
ncbi:S8 family serine peptidase [Candidatus Uhrbacteria bacterium]|nr:S8 family serine peptidase [Candidatus Uhrbacteria bacterium]